MAEEPRSPVAATPREVWTKARRERDGVLGLLLPLAVMDRREAAAVGLLNEKKEWGEEGEGQENAGTFRKEAVVPTFKPRKGLTWPWS